MHISIHAPLAGCDNLGGGVIGHLLYFNPRTPCGVRPYVRGLVDQDSISIHAPLAGCDVECGLRLIGYSQFQSTHPLRGATREALLVARWKRYFNPRTPCGVRPYLDLLSTVVVAISIHAPLAGCDRPRSPIGFTPTYFNPRTPCGVRLRSGAALATAAGFQSTHPLRGATFTNKMPKLMILFQSTHPLRGATTTLCYNTYVNKDFNPRTPCGVRRGGGIFPRRCFLFQSTHPLRGATLPAWSPIPAASFQSTHPLRGATRVVYGRASIKIDFNPRTPCGVRHVQSIRCQFEVKISIHAPLAGCDDVPAGCCATVAVISIHAPLAGCDAGNPRNRGGRQAFQSTHPLRGATLFPR